MKTAPFDESLDDDDDESLAMKNHPVNYGSLSTIAEEQYMGVSISMNSIYSIIRPPPPPRANYNGAITNRDIVSRPTDWKKVLLSTTLIAILVTIMVSIGNSSHSSTHNQKAMPSLHQLATVERERYGDSLSTYLEPTTVVKHFQQRVDHFDNNNNNNNNNTWQHPYFVSDTYFQGPGHPIFVVLGGEGPIHNILYPYVSKRLAKEFGAYVLQTEHRFYGASQPVLEHQTTAETPSQLLHLFTPEQAMADYIAIIRSVQRHLGCSVLKSSSTYCPIVTIGASYPGFLSAIMRMQYGHVVDIGYAASAPMILNAHHADCDTDAYFRHVRNVAEGASAGCASGTYGTLKELYERIIDNGGDTMAIAEELGMCMDTMPDYLKNASPEVFGTELTQLVSNAHADLNMGYYPPDADNLLPRACRIFSDNSDNTAVQRYASFLKLLMTTIDYKEANPLTECFDVRTQIPNGPHGTISSADWTGVGYGQPGTRWEFQVCKDLVIKTGYSADNMFYPPRPWTMEWLTKHCQERFAIDPQPGRLNAMWHFDNLQGHSRLLFTNGIRDGWSVGSFLKVPDVLKKKNDIVVINFPNGTHHSELAHVWPKEGDTSDVMRGRDAIVGLLREWLAELRN